MRQLLLSILSSPLCPRDLRTRLLRLAGARLGRCHVYPGVQFTARATVTLGDWTFINRNALFDNVASITVGDNVQVGPNVSFITSTHKLAANPGRRGGDPYALPVTVGDGSWIGAGVTLLPGVTVGAGSVVAAGAVVTKDLPPNGLYGGVPARLIRQL